MRQDTDYSTVYSVPSITSVILNMSLNKKEYFHKFLSLLKSTVQQKKFSSLLSHTSRRTTFKETVNKVENEIEITCNELVGDSFCRKREKRKGK